MGGKRSKTVLTDVGPVEITLPRDRGGSFEPKIVRKRQKRLTGVDEMVISLAAEGLTTGEVQAHLAEVRGVGVSRQTISTITDEVLGGMAEWQSRPLDPVCPVVLSDAIRVKIRDGAVADRPLHVALAVTAEGRWEILGLWAGDGGEGAKHWLHILTGIKNRGVSDVLMLVCDGTPTKVLEEPFIRQARARQEQLSHPALALRLVSLPCGRPPPGVRRSARPVASGPRPSGAGRRTPSRMRE
ncbi:hypothetical protein GCM10010398_61040 [Streptomyces fimbriatus]